MPAQVCGRTQAKWRVWAEEGREVKGRWISEIGFSQNMAFVQCIFNQRPVIQVKIFTKFGIKAKVRI
jgi:hypothetical protein